MNTDVLWMLIGICGASFICGVGCTIIFIIIWNIICEHHNAKNNPRHIRGKK